MRKQILKSNSGFTLIEVVLVIVIMGILVATALNSVSNLSDTVKIEMTKNEMDILARAITGNPNLNNNGIRTDFGYVGDVGALPSSLSNLLTNPGGYATWKGPYFDNEFSQITDDYNKDAWGENYTYSSANATLTSIGSGTNIIRRIAPSTSDLLYNKISGNIFDHDGTPPGADYDDSVTIRLTIPNGSGGTTIKSISPDHGGYFSYDSIPIGNHNLELIYESLNDTIRRFVSVTPNSEHYSKFNLRANYWPVTGSALGTETLRPNGSGFYTQMNNQGSCTNNWECVDEEISDDDASRVNGIIFSTRTDLYNFEDHSVGTGTIDSVKVYIRVDNGFIIETARTCLRTYNTDYYGAIINLGLFSNWDNYSTTYTLNPSTSSPWQWSEIDNLQAGVRFFSTAKCTQVWAEIYYTNQRNNDEMEVYK